MTGCTRMSRMKWNGVSRWPLTTVNLSIPDIFTKAKRSEVRHGFHRLTRIESVIIREISVYG